MPARGGEPGGLIGDVGQINFSVDGDVIVVKQHDQMTKLLHPGQTDGFLRYALHQATVTGDDIGVVVLHAGPVTGAQHFFGNRKAHGIGQPLTQGAGGGLNPRRMAIFRVACRARAPLAEIPDLINRHVGIAGQVEQRIKQHRPMACRQDEPVPVGPMRRFGVEPQVVLKQHRGHIGHAHRHAGMAGIGRRDRIQRQSADGGGGRPMIRVGPAQCGDIQGGNPL